MLGTTINIMSNADQLGHTKIHRRWGTKMVEKDNMKIPLASQMHQQHIYQNLTKKCILYKDGKFHRFSFQCDITTFLTS